MGQEREMRILDEPWLYSRKMGMPEVEGDLKKMAVRKFGDMTRRI